MKFGISYHLFQVPPWADEYVRYDTAKRLVKQARNELQNRYNHTSLRELHNLLTTDLNMVTSFYNTQCHRLGRRLSLLGLYRVPLPSAGGLGKQGQAMKIAAELNKLLWYGRVNSEAFHNLVRKLDRLPITPDARQWGLGRSLGQSSFVTQIGCLSNLRIIDQWLYESQTWLGAYPEVKLADLEYGNDPEQSINRRLDAALRSGRENNVRMLINMGAGSSLYKNTVGETSLYIAARSGNLANVKALIEARIFSADKVDLAEVQNGWTPLLVACVHGHFEVAKLLVEVGAEPRRKDLRGWSSITHAAFRGHISIAKWLTALLRDRTREGHNEDCLSMVSAPASDAFGTGHRAMVARPVALARTIRAQCTKAEDTSRILIRVGPGNVRNNVKAVELCGSLCSPIDFGHSEMRYCLGIQVLGGANGPSTSFKLPPLSNQMHDMAVFTATDPSRARLAFNLLRVEDMATGTGPVVGSGVVLLDSLKQGFATDFESLTRDYSLPILARSTSEPIAIVTFNYLLTTPVIKPAVAPVAVKGFWEANGHTQVVGHRGNGMNTAARTALQLGENTVQSLTTAATLGANGVEFDVQLTKDLVPVIYHDFTIIEQGGDTPVHALRAEQFSYLSKSQSPRGDLSNMAETRYIERSSGGSTEPHQLSRPRSRSLNVYEDSRSSDMHARMRTTVEGMNAPLKGNVRGLAIQDPFPAFEELLRKVPQSVAFDVELKYPMLWEAEDRDMAPFAVEANVFVDRILEKVYSLGGERRIGFSSFSPEICILLVTKQQDYPTLFLSKSGSIPVGDVRSTSIQQSIAFAKEWGLEGIVMLSDPFVMCPELIEYAKGAGLVCCSYGNLNDEPENAVTQAKAGLDVIIVNKVRLISKTLADFRATQSIHRSPGLDPVLCLQRR